LPTFPIASAVTARLNRLRAAVGELAHRPAADGDRGHDATRDVGIDMVEDGLEPLVEQTLVDVEPGETKHALLRGGDCPAGSTRRFRRSNSQQAKPSTSSLTGRGLNHPR
jgi:hypothetical protein